MMPGRQLGTLPIMAWLEDVAGRVDHSVDRHCRPPAVAGRRPGGGGNSIRAATAAASGCARLCATRRTGAGDGWQRSAVIDLGLCGRADPHLFVCCTTICRAWTTMTCAAAARLRIAFSVRCSDLRRRCSDPARFPRAARRRRPSWVWRWSGRPRMTLELARAAGAAGMVGGQVLDLAAEGRAIALDDLETLHRARRAH